MARGNSRSSQSPAGRSQHRKRRRRVRKKRSGSGCVQEASPACSRSRSPGGPRSRSPSRYGAPMGNRGRDSPAPPSPSHRRRRVKREHRRSPSRRRKSKSPSPVDRRPWIEREKGGVKLFVGRLPREVTQQQLRECFEEFGEVLEVFVIASQAQSGVGCAFVRMNKLEDAEKAIEALHEQCVLIPEMRELGPMQVAFAKGEAIRLGLNEREEILPSFREARQKVEEHKEKKVFFETMQQQQEIHKQIMEHQQAMMQQQQIMAEQARDMTVSELVSLIKDGQRYGGTPFKQRWWSYCDQGWGGTRDYDPTHHQQEHIAQFISMAAIEYGHETWFRKHFDDLPSLPPLPPLPPGMPPPGPLGPGGPPLPFPPPGMIPPGAPPMLPFGPPGMMPPGAMMPPGGMPFPPPGPMGMPPGPPGMGFPPMGLPPDRDRGKKHGGSKSRKNGADTRKGEENDRHDVVSASSGSGSDADIGDVNMDDI
mmetsp:Transcript_21475/g.39358  ORF Transcript_21475/g.39358 Transcript_21475/m.39358 type:complete len:479 (-) Transcript_21475:33-1469(-)